MGMGMGTVRKSGGRRLDRESTGNDNWNQEHRWDESET